MSTKSTTKTRVTKLNAVMRDSLIHSIIRDIPKPNFKDEALALEKDMIAALPAKVRAALKDESAKPYLNTQPHRVNVGFPDPDGGRHGVAVNILNICVPSRTDYPDTFYIQGKNYKPAPENTRGTPPGWLTQEGLEVALACAQRSLDYEKACSQVRVAIRACANTKQLRERHPHFNKYTDAMLAEYAPEVSTNLPDDNLALTLDKLGWPDGKKPSTKSGTR